MITKCFSLGSTEMKMDDKGLDTGSLFWNVIPGSGSEGHRE